MSILIVMYDCIIIDDEPHCIGTLELMIKNHFPDVRILKTCRNGIEGLAAISEFNPNLLFLDVSMPKMDGFEMLSKIAQPDFEVIFTTAHDNYAIKAFKVNAIDYLLKPIDKDEFIVAVGKAVGKYKDRNRFNGNLDMSDLSSFISYIRNDISEHGQLAIPTMEGFQMIKIAKIFYILSDGNYSRIYFKNDQVLLVTRTLKQLEKILRDNGFLRIHRQTIVNIAHIERYVRGEGGYVVLSNKKHLDVSRRKKEELLKLISL